MRYPKMNTQRNSMVSVPQLNGGLNLCDLPNHINDNQLIDCKNVWWFNGALQTRPGLTQAQVGTLPVGATGAVSRFAVSNSVSEREVLLGQFREPPAGGEGGTFTGCRLSLDDGLVNLGWRTDVALDQDSAFTSFGVKTSKGSESNYYFFLSDGSVLQQGAESEEELNRTLVDAEPYIPLVLVNGKAAKSGEPTGTMYEGRNMLTGKCKCTYTTKGKDTDGDAYPYTAYNVPHSKVVSVELMVNNRTNQRTIKIKENSMLIDPNDTTKWETLTAHEAGEEAQERYPDCDEFEVLYEVWKAGIDLPDESWSAVSLLIRPKGEYGGMYWNPPAVVANNLTIVVEDLDSSQRRTICKMTQCTWFGGDRSGVNGGTRLFACGNPDKPNLVCWSDVNNPLYFPENNYAYIGGADEAVTGFGKQGDLLVIFKEHEIYAAQYVAGTDFTYDDVISGAVTDVTAYLAHFPITPIHPNIGCDCPNTIRLVDNRLVWATSDKHVYMLTGVNQWSERNVRDITARIRPHLDKQEPTDIRNAVAGEYKGYYTLLVGKTLYLMGTGNSAFQNYTHYASENKASRSLPWYVWKLDSKGDEWVTTVSDGERFYILKQPVYMPLYGGQEWKLYELDGDSDDGDEIVSSFSTKLYDFGRVDTKKFINQIYVTVKDGKDSRIKVSYLTDRYTTEEACIIKCDSNESDLLQTYRLRPNVHMVRQFGIKMEAEKPLIVSGLTINYQNQGVVR